jgi:large subunit ribosomal protein L30
MTDKFEKVSVKQIRSGNRCPSYQRRTLEALGLGKLNRVRTHNWNPVLQGMVRSVTHLVEVTPVTGK